MTARPVVVVVGSLHYDIMVDAPDRPRRGETVTGHSWHPKFGGKGGNQAVAAAQAGAEVRFFGAVGDDAFGGFLLEALDRGGVDASRVERLSGIGSGMSVAISDSGGDYGAVIVSGANLRIDASRLQEPALWKDAKALILQNEVPDAVNVAAARAARAQGVLVCLNAAPARPMPDALSSLLDLLVVNTLEAEALAGQPVSGLASAAAAAQTICQWCATVVVTCGGDGVAGIQRGAAELLTLPAVPVSLVSTHGAGDAFVGSLITTLASGRSFQSALAEANAAGARHVSRMPS